MSGFWDGVQTVLLWSTGAALIFACVVAWAAVIDSRRRLAMARSQAAASADYSYERMDLYRLWAEKRHFTFTGLFVWEGAVFGIGGTERSIRRDIGRRWDAMMTFLTQAPVKPWGLTKVHSDKYGTLWRVWLRFGWAYVVEVENSTPPHRHHFIPVDRWMRPIREGGQPGGVGWRRWQIMGRFPQRRTARNAVASTFGLRGGQYKVVAAS